MAQITNITSEALQATIRRLLPSQQGFGEDLQASNVITPVIDLTPTAEGSVLGSNLQTALAFGSQTDFNVNNAFATLANSPGFWRVYGNYTYGTSSGAVISYFYITDGTSNKNLWYSSASNGTGGITNFDFTVFLRAGDSLVARSASTLGNIAGSYRQIATVTGTLVNPNGFTFE